MGSLLWPPLPFAAWRDTLATVHRYAQIVGKIQLELTPRSNHFWNAALELTARGLSTRAMPYGGRFFQMELDFVDHGLVVRSSDGAARTLALIPRTVADFHAEVLAVLASLGIHVHIWDHPVEIATDPIRFSEDRMHGDYDADAVVRCFRILLRTAAVLEEFRGRFVGKASPVQFWWGTFDLAASRFSGRRVAHPPSGTIEREAYSHEVSSAGWWPGDDRFPAPAFYAYHQPVPDGYASAAVRPSAAMWHAGLRNFLLPYDVVRSARSPRAVLLEFFQSTYEAGAELAGWDRAALERAAEPEPETAAPTP